MTYSNFENSEEVKHLEKICNDKDWFHSISMDQFGRLVVYTHKMNKEVFHLVPDRINKLQVLVHFVGSALAKKEDFISYPDAPFSLMPVKIIEELTDDEVTMDLQELEIELDRLEKICGNHILSEIFFELHDKHNAVTNLSGKYPAVRDSVAKLYDEYGFDILYEQIEG